jgi:hypothetical protein
MPAFNQFQVPPYSSFQHGSQFRLFDNEAVVANEISQVMCVSPSSSNLPTAITFQGEFAAAPTASVQIFGSNFPPTTTPQNGVTVGLAQTTQNWQYTDNTGFMYYWAVVSSYSAGGNFTLIAN